MNVEALLDRVRRLEGERARVGAERDSLIQKKATAISEREDLLAALEIIQAVARATQQELEYHISELVTLALRAVFPQPYKLVLTFESRRNRSEADLLLEDANGNRIRPLDSVGGGVVDVAAFALRVAVWSLIRPRPRPTMFQDEPFRFVSRDLQPRVSQMLKEVSTKLGIQFVVISHEENLLEAADKVFQVRKVRNVSKVSVEA